MKTRLLATLLAGLLLFLPTFSAAAAVDVLKSTRPLQIEHAIMTVSTHDDDSVTIEIDEHFDNICTTSSINENKHYWITAAHCISAELTYFVAGHQANVVMRDVLNDLAILQTPDYSVPALKLGKAPKIGDEIVVAGHPYGWPEVMLVRGAIASLSQPALLRMADYPRPFMMLNVAGAPGNSGSPVVNKRGELVSVVQIWFGQRGTFSPMLGGVIYDTLAKYANYWKD